MKTLTARELLERIEHDDVVVLDVLPRVSYDKQHLPDAEHASFYDDDFLERVAELVDSKDASVVVYCLTSSCNASARAAEALREAGYGNVFDFEGGLREWEEEGLPVIRRRA